MIRKLNEIVHIGETRTAAAQKVMGSRCSIHVVWIGLLFTILQSCADKAVVDVNYPLSQHTWLSNYAVRVPVDISDTTQVYKLYVNLRNTSDYSFSNIVLKLDIQGPDNTRELVEKTDIKLAYPDGEWKGSGAAAYYTHQVLVKEQYRFPVKGNYVIGIRHLMSASALKGISDVGLKIEPAG